MTRELDKFQIQLLDTSNFPVHCVKCDSPILPIEDSEHVVLWGVGVSPWHLHIICFGDVTAGMVEFFKVFITDQRKQKVLQ